jgi:hypothetical protein
MDRRGFLMKTAALGSVTAGLSLSFQQMGQGPEVAPVGPERPALVPGQRPYRGPNVILIRFGGGVRRLETILDPERTYCPFIYHELFRKQGILYNNVQIEPNPGIVTSHGQGTLYILTGRYDRYEDITHRFLADRFEPKVPTLFEYFRRTYNIPSHQALIINGEDRINEEFFTFSNHHLYGVRYRSTVLSLYRYKTFLLREQIREGRLPEAELEAKRTKLRQMETLDYRVQNTPDVDANAVSPELNAFWRKWRGYYGSSGLVNPRGDRLLTTLALWSARELRPRLMMINYQDPDYVHWGNPTFYTRAISVIDEGVRQIYDATQADEVYRNNTVFVIVPDCGRDNNRCMSVPFQHHFNTRSAHEVFVVAAGRGIAHPRDRHGEPLPVGNPSQQCSVAGTVGRIMGFPTPEVDGGAGALGEIFA